MKARWRFDAGSLPTFVPVPSDGLIVGVFSGPEAFDGEGMVASVKMEVAEDVSVGAAIRISHFDSADLVMLHRRFTPLMASRAAWAVGVELRRLRGSDGSRVVMAATRPNPDVTPPGVTLTTHRVRIADNGIVVPFDVWEIHYVAAGGMLRTRVSPGDRFRERWPSSVG
ncbi:hypothetical protein [Frankia sp. R43]|uniref:hypothetical protein n=1 Tax=Frankia sp. R43 TaxID=269536 RepID=UPI0007C81A49|nr:hypothetical protein [Frankia sp. R43]